MLRKRSSCLITRLLLHSVGRESVMKLSLLLICLGSLLAATALGWTPVWDRNTIKLLYQQLKAGRVPVGVYATIMAPVSLTLVLLGMYLALTWR
jgi:uncharacterized membrane protein